MGVFDSVYATCACGELLEWQTKAMPCPYLERFPLDAVPIAAALDLQDSTAHCEKCGRTYALRCVMSPLPETVRMLVDQVDGPR